MNYAAPVPTLVNHHRLFLFGLPWAFIVYGLTVQERRGGWRLPAWLHRFGDASYSIYLTHLTVFLTFIHLFPVSGQGRLAHLAWVAPADGVRALVGFLFHHGVERPLLNLARKPRQQAKTILDLQPSELGGERKVA